MKEIGPLADDQDRAAEETDKLVTGLREAIDSLRIWKKAMDSIE